MFTIMTWLIISSPPYISANGPFVSRGSRSNHILYILFYRFSFIFSFIYSLVHSLLYTPLSLPFYIFSCTFSFILSCVFFCTHSLVHSLAHSLVHSLVDSLLYILLYILFYILLKGNKTPQENHYHELQILSWIANCEIFEYSDQWNWKLQIIIMSCRSLSWIAKFSSTLISETPECSSLTRMYSLMLTRVCKKTTTAAPTITFLSSSSPSKLGQKFFIPSLPIEHKRVTPKKFAQNRGTCNSSIIFTHSESTLRVLREIIQIASLNIFEWETNTVDFIFKSEKSPTLCWESMRAEMQLKSCWIRHRWSTKPE